MTGPTRRLAARVWQRGRQWKWWRQQQQQQQQLQLRYCSSKVQTNSKDMGGRQMHSMVAAATEARSETQPEGIPNLLDTLPMPSLQREKYRWSSKLLGHLAQIEPWKGGSRLSLRMRNKVEEWSDELYPEKTYVVKLMGRSMVVTSDPVLVREVTITRAKEFIPPSSFASAWAVIFPDHVLALSGERHKRIRSLIIRAIKKLDKSLLPGSTYPITIKVLGEYHERYGNDQEIDLPLFDVFSEITFDTFNLFAYGMEPSSENRELLHSCIGLAENLNSRSIIPIPILWKLPTHENREVERHSKTIRNKISEILNDRKGVLKNLDSSSETVKKPTLMDAMILASMEETNSKFPVTDEELLSNVGILFFGGFDTTASTLSLGLRLLALPENEQIQEDLYEAVKDFDFSSATADDLENIVPLRNAVKEMNRMDATAFMISREALRDTVIQLGDQQYKIPKDTTISVNHHKMAREPQLWQDAIDLETFRPSRWDKFEPEKGSYVPFGLGIRSCAGVSIAYPQLHTIVGTLVQNYKITTIPDQPVQYWSSVGVSVTKDSKLRFTKRQH